MNSSQFLGLDVGEARTGIARGSEAARLAEPLMTVKTTEVLKTLQTLIKEQNIEAVVVGLPRNLEGQDTAQTAWVRRWVAKIKGRIDAAFYWQDEALTSRLAETQKLAGKSIQDTDSLAAAIILQDFLDTPPAERVVC